MSSDNVGEALHPVFRCGDHCVRILGQNAGKFTLQGTNTYLLGTGRSRILVDTGDGNGEYGKVLGKVLRAENVDEISCVLLSHGHFDHVGGVLQIRKWFPNVKVYKGLATFENGSHISNAVAGEVLGVLPLVDGMVFRTKGCSLKCIHTPGHTSDHFCFYVLDDESLLSGDLVLGSDSSCVFQDLASYMESLDKILNLKSRRILPGHGQIIDRPSEYVKQYVKHRMDREIQILNVLQTNAGLTCRQIVRGIYKQKMSFVLFKAACGNVNKHLIKLMKDGKQTMDNDELLLNPELALQRKQERRIRHSQMNARRRTIARQHEEQVQLKIKIACNRMHDEEILSKQAWEYARKIEEALAKEEEKKHEILLRERIVAMRLKVEKLGLSQSTPGLLGEDRLRALENNIELDAERKRKAALSKQSFFDRQAKFSNNKIVVAEKAKTFAIEKLENAIEARNWENFLPLFAQGGNPNQQSVHGITPIMSAILVGKKAFLRQLKKNGADVNFESYVGYTPILLAVLMDDIVALDVLHELGGEINGESRFGVTPMLLAVQLCRINIIERLLELKVNINRRNKFGVTPLIHSAKCNQVAICRLLLRNGANAYIKDQSKRTALAWAKHQNFVHLSNMVENALSRGKLSPTDPLTYLEKQEATSLRMAGVNLLAACQHGTAVNAIQVLEESDKIACPNFECADGTTILIAAIRNGATMNQIVQLVELGCLLGFQNKIGTTALMVACELNRIDLVAAILGLSHNTAWSSLDGDTSQFLLNQRNHIGQTAANIADSCGHLDLVDFMVKCNHAKTGDDRYVFQLCCPMDVQVVQSRNATAGIQLLREAPQNMSAVYCLHVAEPKLSNPIIPKPTMDDRENDEVQDALAKRWTKTEFHLHRDKQRRNDFNNERLQIVKCNLRGRRNGLLGTKASDIEERERLPVCPHCNDIYARKRCHTCCSIFCDRCFSSYHLSAKRRHHKFEDVLPVKMLDGIEYEAGLKKRNENLRPDVEKSLQVMKDIRHMLDIEPPNTEPEDDEIRARNIKFKIAEKKKLVRRDVVSKKMAVKDAENDGSNAYRKPAELALAKFLMTQKRYTEAGNCIFAAYETQVGAYGDAHPIVARTLVLKAEFYSEQSMFRNAKQALQHALAIFENHYTLDHLDMVSTFDAFIASMIQLGDYDEGIERCTAIRILRIKKLGFHHPLVASTIVLKELIIRDRETKQMFSLDRIGQRRLDLDENGEMYALEKLGRLESQFEELLGAENDPIFESFQVHAHAKLSQDNLTFYLQVHSFRNLEPGTKPFRLLGKTIYRTFIKSQKLGSLTASIRNAIRKQLNTPGLALSVDIFNTAQSVVFQAMYHSIYLDFIQQPAAQQWYLDKLYVKRYSNQLLQLQRFFKSYLFRKRLAKSRKRRAKSRKTRKKTSQ